MRTLTPAKINTINRNFIQLKKINFDYLTKILFESISPSEFPFEVGNSNLWIAWLSVEFGILLCN